MTYAKPDALVETDWLERHLAAPDVHIVDGTCFLPNEARDARAEYDAQHIPGAVFFDIDEIADTANPLPHMLPSPEKFSSRVRKLGLGDGVKIVVYDTRGMFSAARVWWTFKVMGARDVAVLNGGLPKWLAEGRPVTDEPTMPTERHFTARLDNTQVREKDQILRLLETAREQIVDARSPGRFAGTEPEVRPGLRGGHIPGSANVPYGQLCDPADGRFLPADGIKAKFEAAGVDLSKPVVTTCGSGVTAAVLALGLHLIGHRDVAVYDGSWTEWGQPGDTPVETSRN